MERVTPTSTLILLDPERLNFSKSLELAVIPFTDRIICEATTHGNLVFVKQHLTTR